MSAINYGAGTGGGPIMRPKAEESSIRSRATSDLRTRAQQSFQQPKTLPQSRSAQAKEAGKGQTLDTFG